MRFTGSHLRPRPLTHRLETLTPFQKREANYCRPRQWNRHFAIQSTGAFLRVDHRLHRRHSLRLPAPLPRQNIDCDSVLPQLPGGRRDRKLEKILKTTSRLSSHSLYTLYWDHLPAIVNFLSPQHRSKKVESQCCFSLDGLNSRTS